MENKNNVQCRTQSNVLIGSGGYSKVYKTGNKAVKKVFSNKHDLGIESPMEIYIMSCIKSPYLAHSCNLVIHATSEVDIYQDLAYSNLSQFSKINIIPENILKRYIWQVCKAVQVLHKKGIIHGDIKGSNVLLYYDSDYETSYVKLADFSLSTFVSTSGTLHNHKTYTVTHRPLEVWQKLGYSYPADIWALGATLYEIYYRKLLFPVQTGDNKHDIYMKLHDEWCMNPVHINTPHEDKQFYIDKSYILPLEWKNENNYIFNDLLLCMLDINPNNRMNIDEILQHEYFFDVAYTPVELDIPLMNTHLQMDGIRDMALILRHYTDNCATWLCYLLIAYKMLDRKIPSKIKKKINCQIKEEEIRVMNKIVDKALIKPTKII